MAKQKRKLTRVEKAAKARRKAEFEFILVNGKQKRMRRPVLIEGMTADEFIRANADPIWLHQNEMWVYGRSIPKRGSTCLDSITHIERRPPADGSMSRSTCEMVP